MEQGVVARSGEVQLIPLVSFFSPLFGMHSSELQPRQNIFKGVRFFNARSGLMCVCVCVCVCVLYSSHLRGRGTTLLSKLL